MSGGDTGKVFVGEYRVEAVRGKAGDLASLRLHLDANLLLKLLTDPAEPTRTTLELVGVDGSRTVRAPALVLPETLVARATLGVAVLGLAALVWVVVGMFSSSERALDWHAPSPTAVSAPRSTLPAPSAAPTPVVEAPAPALSPPAMATPPSVPIRLVPEPAASPAPAVARALKASAPARLPMPPATRAATPGSPPLSSAALAAAPFPATHAPPANVLDLFNDTK